MDVPCESCKLLNPKTALFCVHCGKSISANRNVVTPPTNSNKILFWALGICGAIVLMVILGVGSLVFYGVYKARQMGSDPEINGRQEAQEPLGPEQGEAIDYNTLYAKSHSTGLPVGKRFRVRAATLSNGVDLFPPNMELDWDRHEQCKPDFDDNAQYERFLAGGDGKNHIHEVVVSMGEDGWLHIHKIR